MAKKDSAIDPAPATSLASLGDLLRARGVGVGDSAPRPAVVPPAAAPSPPHNAPLAAAGKIVVRRERKGHGGKTVTVVDGLAVPARELEAIARELRKQLGCGSWVDERRVVLQGDVARGVETWLRARGATRIVQGN